MQQEMRDELIALIEERATNVDDIIGIIIKLEDLYDFRASIVTRNDVESEFETAWEFDGGEKRKMTDEEWDTFCSEWFWRKGHSEVMWDRVPDAILRDLRDLDIVPRGKVIE